MGNLGKCLLMHIVVFMASWTCIVSCNFEQKETMNPIIGNDGEEYFYTFTHINSLSEELRITAHLSYVYKLLSERTNRMADSDVKSKRLSLLAHLRNYIRRAEFPINSKFDERKPCFIDENGTYCAVGYLIQQSEGSELAEKINTLFQYDYLSDMQLPALNDWIAASGFSLKELAMIQPTYGKYILKNSFSAGAGVSYRGIDNGYPSFRLSYGKNIKDKIRMLHGRMEVVGQNDYYSSISAGYSTKLSNKKYLNNRRIGVFIGPALLVEEGQTAWLIKPEIQMNLFDARLFKNYFLSGILGYAYDVSLTKRDLFPANRNDISLHLVIGRVKGGKTY